MVRLLMSCGIFSAVNAIAVMDGRVERNLKMLRATGLDKLLSSSVS